MISLHRGPSQCGTEGTACPVQGVGHAENGDSKWTRSSWFQQIVSWFCVKTHLKTQNHCFSEGARFRKMTQQLLNHCFLTAGIGSSTYLSCPCCKRGSPLHSDEKLGEFFVISFVVFVHRPRGLGNQEKWMRNTQDHESLRSWIAQHCSNLSSRLLCYSWILSIFDGLCVSRRCGESWVRTGHVPHPLSHLAKECSEQLSWSQVLLGRPPLAWLYHSDLVV